MEKMAKEIKRGRYLFCPNGSHLAAYDDPAPYWSGLLQFIADVDAKKL